MRIVVDAFGGDNAPVEIVEGALLAVEKNKDLIDRLKKNNETSNGSKKDDYKK